MSGQYTWQNTRRRSSYRMPNREHIGRFVAIALAVAVTVHAGLYYAFGKITWKVDFRRSNEWESRQFAVEQVSIDSEPKMLEAIDYEALPDPTKESVPYDETDLLQALDETQEVDISPDIPEPENLFIPAPALEGLPEAEPERELVKAAELTDDLDELANNSLNEIKEIPDGQLIIDPGKQEIDLVDPDQWNQEQLKRRGFAGGDPNGLLKNYSDLDALIASPIGSLGDRTRPARLGSDLLFDFDSAELREEAHLSLMKLGALITRHSQTFFVLEGHTDTLGSAHYNQKLGFERAKAVREWLIRELALDSARIFVQSAGSSRPIVKDAGDDRDAQQLNRRVEIHMRKENPEKSSKKEATTIPEQPHTDKPDTKPVPEAEKVDPPPTRAIPVEEEVPPSSPRRAQIVSPKRAVPVEP